MLYVRVTDKLNIEVIQIDESCGTIAQLIIAMLSEGEFSLAYVHNAHLKVQYYSFWRQIPENDPPRTTTTCRLVGASGDVEVLCAK